MIFLKASDTKFHQTIKHKIDSLRISIVDDIVAVISDSSSKLIDLQHKVEKLLSDISKDCCVHRGIESENIVNPDTIQFGVQCKDTFYSLVISTKDFTGQKDYSTPKLSK